MAYTTSSAIWRALVQKVRANTALKAALNGGIHEGFAPEKVEYPMAVYVPVAMPYESTWSSRAIIALVDVTIFSRSQVEASNLDQSMLETLDGATLTPEGQTFLICRRVNDLRIGPELDEEGLKVYGVGGSYEIWTSQNA
jgi:hypothetical protein